LELSIFSTVESMVMVVMERVSSVVAMRG